MAGESVLVVDDNTANLELIEFLLTTGGYSVRTATSAADALAVLTTFRPRLILMDLQLPGIDGFALTRTLKADPATKAIVIIAVTAYAMKGDEERASAAGCDGYMTKPIDTRTFLATVAAHLARAH
jgi:two-component system, cell cycle response regulator DivK